MQVTFLGGAGEVGRLAALIDVAGLRLLFDYGFTASKPAAYPERAPPVDAIFVTHSHLDHVGMVPEAIRRHQSPIYATEVTTEVAELLCLDSIKIADIEGKVFPYTLDDVTAACNTADILDHTDYVEFEGAMVLAHRAGHLPGASMYELSVESSTLFTGDMCTTSTRLVQGAKPVRCRNLIIEGTYAGRDHPDRHELELEFLDRIDDVIDRGGHVIIPAFAVGRTQEVLLMLEDSGHEIWLDGMGKKVNQLYMDYGEYLKAPGALRAADSNVKYVKSEAGRARAMEADIIVTTSGMLEGGPVGRYIDRHGNDPRSAIFLTGYQVEGTAGRRLMDEGVFTIDEEPRRVAAELEYFDFSSHAGHADLINFIKRCQPERVVVMHSANSKAIADDPALGGIEFILPENGKSFTLPD